LKIVLDFLTTLVSMVDVMTSQPLTPSDLPVFFLALGFVASLTIGICLCLDMAQAARRGDLDLPLRAE
jgi:hypothetical protein